MPPVRLAFLPFLLLTGCMEGNKPKPIARAGTKSQAALYQRLGGEPGIRKIVDDFCAEVLASDKIREVHKKHFRDDEEALKKKLVDQFGEESGGPQKYTGRSMKEAHKGLGITETDFAGLVAALVAALDKNKIAADDQKEFLGKLARFKDDVIETKLEGVSRKKDD
jgi:hemoglobin